MPSDSSQYKIQPNNFLNSDAVFKNQGLLTRNLTRLAEQNELAPVLGRNKELTWLTRRLICYQKPNAILVGPTGAGKTSLVEGLATKFLCENPLLSHFEIIEVNGGSLLANTAFRGDFERKLIQLLERIKSDRNTVLFIDEAHTLAMTGDVQGGGMDALNLMKPFLLSGQIRCLLATTSEEAKIIENDPAFMRRFAVLPIEHLGAKEQKAALVSHKERFERLHGVAIQKEILDYLIEKYLCIPGRLDKTLDLMDETCAQTRLLNQNEATLSILKEIEI